MKTGFVLALTPVVLSVMTVWQPCVTETLAQTASNVSFTEILPFPGKGDPVAGQWVELQNLAEQAINLQGMVLMSTSLDGFHAISPAAEMILEPGSIVLLGASTDQNLNGGAPVTYSYGNDVQLDPEADMIFLMKSGQIVDYVSYGPSGIETRQGVSLSREPGGGQTSSWCFARTGFGDGDLGTPGVTNTWCDDDRDSWAEDQGDCDDTNPGVNPEGTEVCNGLDDNCNGLTDENVVAEEGTCPSRGVCEAMVPLCSGASGFTCPPVEGWEPDGETLCDGRDNDCDGLTDELLRYEGLPLGDVCAAPGDCGTGTVVCSPQTARPTCSTLPDGTTPMDSVETCDHRDNDCDGLTDEGFDVGTVCSSGLGACAREGVLECDDNGDARCDAIPGEPETELCGDRVDNDCDGDTDEGFETGQTCSTGTGACQAFSKFVCSPDLLSVTCPAVPSEPSGEICGDGIDNDCDGDTDELDCNGISGGCSTGDDAHAGPLPVILLIMIAVGLYRLSARIPTHRRQAPQ